MHAPAILQRHQDDVGRDRRPAEDVDAYRIGNRIHHGAVTGADRRFTNPLGAHRRPGIRQADGLGVHAPRDVENGERLAVMEPVTE